MPEGSEQEVKFCWRAGKHNIPEIGLQKSGGEKTDSLGGLWSYKVGNAFLVSDVDAKVKWPKHLRVAVYHQDCLLVCFRDERHPRRLWGEFLGRQFSFLIVASRNGTSKANQVGRNNAKNKGGSGWFTSQT